MTYTRGIARIEFGDIAQLGERCVRIAEVGGSNPPISTRKSWKDGWSALRKTALTKGLSRDIVKAFG